MARKFDSEIVVDSQDRWIFRGNEITQPEILSYFRQNLKENEQGVYIENQFGELVENGYLLLHGFPCHILDIHQEGNQVYFVSDDQSAVPEMEWEIFESKKGDLFALQTGRPKIRYRFGWKAASQLANFLREEKDGIYLSLGPVHRQILVFDEPIEIALPVNFDFA